MRKIEAAETTSGMSRRRVLMGLVLPLAAPALVPLFARTARAEKDAAPWGESRFAESAGSRIHYTVAGSGPLVVLLHGFQRSGERWHEYGYVAPLAEHFTVAAIDSLGHGQSDRPPEAERYLPAPRARDVVAVIDDLGRDRAHVVGYSMGGWQAVAVSRHHPERLASIVVGGWDCRDGLKTAFGGRDYVSLADFIGMLPEAVSMKPEQVRAWSEAPEQVAARDSWEAFWDLEDGAAPFRGLPVPTLFWSGREDPYHGAMQDLAYTEGFPFLSTPGTHLSAFTDGAQDALPDILRFLQGT